jgi:hypothetical protein
MKSAVACSPRPEFFAQQVDCMLGVGDAPINEIGKIGSIGGAQRPYADGDQPKHASIDLGCE